MHLIDCKELARNWRYVLQYSDSEMAEVFDAAEREALAAGYVIKKSGCQYVDLQAFYDRTA